jgi:NAD-dependent SIR2 family protein deacetylase
VLQAKVKILASLINKALRTVAYTGAGISTASGIADYATKSGGNSTTRPELEQLATPYDAAPTQAHKVLVALHKKGHLERWVQQNHDGLPQKAGYPQHKLNEIHGAWFDPSNPVVPMDGTLRRDLLEQLLGWEQETDLCLAFGSTLCGMNADRICTSAAQRNRAGLPGELGLVIVNLQQTQYDHLCSLRIFARIDDVLVALARELQLELSPTPVIPQGDIFDVPYNALGERGEGRSTLDLRPGAEVRFVWQPQWDEQKHGSVAKVVRRTDRGDWELALPSGSHRRLGSWWVQEALDGKVDHLPVVNLPSAE